MEKREKKRKHEKKKVARDMPETEEGGAGHWKNSQNKAVNYRASVFFSSSVHTNFTLDNLNLI